MVALYSNSYSKGYLKGRGGGVEMREELAGMTGNVP